MTQDLPLAAGFPPATEAEWRKLVEAALKGASFEKRLVRETYDGLRIEPLYPRAAGVSAVAGRAAVPWQILQRVDHPDPKAANAEALHELENGATGLSLVFGGSAGAYCYGLDCEQNTTARVLEGIHLDAGIALELDMSGPRRDAGVNLAAVLKHRGVAPEKTQIRFGYDPLGAEARNGCASHPWPQLGRWLTETVSKLIDQGFNGPFVVADGRCVHSAGGSEAQELAFVIANAVTYLRTFAGAGIPLTRARELIYFRLAADADEFLTIAKFRALRKLWARIEEVSGLTPQPAFISAETAWRMMTARDPYVNILRATIAVTAAGVGGADAIGVLPFTMALGLPDRFARRVARNLQHVLLEESNLYRVADPAAGSGGIEALTEQLARSAWSLFQDIEAHGGAPAAIECGLLQKRVATVRAARQTAVARRKDALTGVSDYPHLSERPVKTLDVPRVDVPPLAPTVRCEALPQIRLAEPFEALRDASDRILAKTGARPKVFLANLGRLSDFTARATFAKNFYEAGGIEAIGNDGFLPSPVPVGEGSSAKRSGSNPSPAPSPSAPERPLPIGEVKTDFAVLIAAFKASGCKLACLCSSDAVYAQEAADAAKALSEAGAIVHLAGRGGEHEPVWRQAGVKTHIYTGCDVLSTLRAARDSLGVK
jgi:methylmalonyl-CoA mutase